MELVETIRRRRMIRAFTPGQLEREEVDELLDLARRAPSAGNTQSVGFVVLDDHRRRAMYWDNTMAPDRRSTFRWQTLLTAPVLILITTDPNDYVRRYLEVDKKSTKLGQGQSAWPVPYWWVDAGAVIQNLLLLATDKGWAACLFGPFEHEPEVARAVGLCDDRRIVATIALGLPELSTDTPGRSATRQRLPIGEIVNRP